MNDSFTHKVLKQFLNGSAVIQMSLSLSRIVKEQIKKPSPIRQIMKMAERQNIINMGINPDEVISFGGGWVNHLAPEEMREEYLKIINNKELFHKSGGYSATLGDLNLRGLIAQMEGHVFGMKNISEKNIIIGQSSTQVTHDLFVTLLDPGDSIMLLDPTYANYPGQLAFTGPEVKIHRLPVLDTEQWKYTPSIPDTIDRFHELYEQTHPKIILIPSPDNPTSQIMHPKIVEEMQKTALDGGSYLVMDAAYKTQYFGEMPSYYAWSPEDYPNLIALHSNSKWARGLGRRLGWVEGPQHVIDGMERVQQVSILCPDSLHQMAISAYLERAMSEGSLIPYLNKAREDYKSAAENTLKAIDENLGMPRLVPQGALYTVIDVGRDADEFVPEVLKHTGVLLIPGKGFGDTLKNAVRVSYGPLVLEQEKIFEGMERVGKYLNKK